MVFQNLVAAEVTRLKLKKIWSLLTSAATVLKIPPFSMPLPGVLAALRLGVEFQCAVPATAWQLRGL
jgi:hypothetical protein